MSPEVAGRFFTTEPPEKSKEEMTVLTLKKNLFFFNCQLRLFSSKTHIGKWFNHLLITRVSTAKNMLNILSQTFLPEDENIFLHRLNLGFWDLGHSRDVN